MVMSGFVPLGYRPPCNCKSSSNMGRKRRMCGETNDRLVVLFEGYFGFSLGNHHSVSTPSLRSLCNYRTSSVGSDSLVLSTDNHRHMKPSVALAYGGAMTPMFVFLEVISVVGTTVRVSLSLCAPFRAYGRSAA
jgi:hypothetical protein